MEKMQESHEQPTEFPERIGNDLELWKKYHETYGAEAYKYRRIAEGATEELYNLYKYAEENNIKLPGSDNSGTILT